MLPKKKKNALIEKKQTRLKEGGDIREREGGGERRELVPHFQKQTLEEDHYMMNQNIQMFLCL
jgi:hypothetical protein